MFKRAVLRGVTAGAGAGLAYGLYVAVVATPLIGYAETYESGGEPAAVSDLVATLGSVLGGVLYGILLGTVAFGVAFYLLEPALPGTDRTKRYLVAAAGFLIVSGVPWLVLPPVPPGVDQSLPTTVRLVWYAGSMAIGALACGLAVRAYTRLEPAYGRGAALLGAGVGLVPVAVLLLMAPPNRTTGPVPDVVATVFAVSTAVGQIGLWALLAIAHVWLTRRAVFADRATEPPSDASADVGPRDSR